MHKSASSADLRPLLPNSLGAPTLQPQMLVEERQRVILDRLRGKKTLTVEEAMELCDVSADTIRRDFRKLSEQNLARRTHGGILLQDEYAADSPLRERQVLHHEEKRRIGARAAGYIQPGETVAIDAGTTAIEILPFLAELSDMTVLTYSLDVARTAVDSRSLTCIMLGGLIRENTYSAVGPDTLSMVQHFQVTTLLLAANGISLEHGIMTPNRMEAEVKSGLIQIAQRVILVADSSKIGRRALVSFSDFSKVDALVTDTAADPAFVEAVSELGVSVSLV